MNSSVSMNDDRFFFLNDDGLMQEIVIGTPPPKTVDEAKAVLDSNSINWIEVFDYKGARAYASDIIKVTNDPVENEIIDIDYYKWVMPVETTDGHRLLAIEGDEINLSDLMFKSPEEAVDALKNEEWGWSLEDAEDFKLVRVHQIEQDVSLLIENAIEESESESESNGPR